MADFPTFTRNEQVATKPLVITPPAFNANDARDAQTRYVDQQWRDLAKSGVGKTHPLSINRDSAFVTSDPYTTP